MDLDKFYTSWWTTPSSTTSFETEEWMEQTFADPTAFWNSLIVLQNALSPKPIKSILGDHYDFYYDMVLRHVESNPAVLLIEEGGFVQTWTYKKLHRLVNFQVKAWLKQSVKKGQLVVIMAPVGIYYVIALLTALRLGLKICFLPTGSRFLGKKHLLHLLDQIKPNFVIGLTELDVHFPIIYVDNLGEDEFSNEPESFPYPAHETMQLSIALYRQKPFTIVPLDASTTYLHALRDGLLTFNLKPGTTNSTTHSCSIRSEPCSTLMTFLSGAALVHVEEEELIKDPLMIKNEKVHLLESSLVQQKLWSKAPGTPKQLKGHYKTPWNHYQNSWGTFIETNKLENVPVFHLLMDNSFGGALFFSKPTTKNLDYFMKPSLGTPWSLKELNRPGEDTFKGFGLMSLQTTNKENNDETTNLIISSINKNCLISSTLLPSRDGVTIPSERIELAAKKLPFVESSVLYTFPEMGEVVNHQLVLLVFISPAKSDISDEMRKEWTQQLSVHINDEVGAAFVPDRFEYFPLVPKMQDGFPDRNWCIEQYNRGFLYKKKNIHLYQVLSMLKKIMQSDKIA